NPTTTPDLLDVLQRERALATFFVIDRNITDQTAPILQRMVAGGHAIALHSHTRRYMIMPSGELARTLRAAANHIQRIAWRAPCAAFMPQGGWRSATMYASLRRIDHKLIGFGWMLWDWNWFRRRTADSIVKRLGARISAGDIVVMHDGDESHPFA